MASGKVFISHTSKDDGFVKSLQAKLEAHGIATWVDSRQLVGGNKLEAEIEEAIEDARSFIAVLSPNVINSPWVKKEIGKALEVEKAREDGYRVIPLLLPGVAPVALGFWFDDEPVGVRVELDIDSLDEALPQILAALGEQLPEDREPEPELPAQPVDELVLRLQDPKIETLDGKVRATATATLIYEPAAAGARRVESARYKFVAPLGAIEYEEIRWYIEEFFRWPVGVFRDRAGRTEAQFPAWGQALFEAATRAGAAQTALNAWQNARGEAERRFSIWVDDDLPEGAPDADKAAAAQAASGLMALPWEMLHDGDGFLFRGKSPVRVRRRLPNREPIERGLASLPIRILLASPRPEDDHAGYIDHRASARPLVEAVENLGVLAELTVLDPPTFGKLEDALRKASEAGKPYAVVHFDGHGVFDHRSVKNGLHGLGALVFEDPKDTGKLEGRASDLVDAQKIAETLRDYRVPLVFLDACQGARFDKDPSASVAAHLLEAGVTSVVAMTHSVLVPTAGMFVQAFYRALAEGRRVGQAMLHGQQALANDTYRMTIMSAGELRLQDWFVPVLYQEEQDPQLFTRLPGARVRQLAAQAQRIRLGNLPEPPAHSFVGRSHSLLVLERLLLKEKPGYAVLLGTGGAGKTTFAAELARWLARTGRFGRVAFVSLETLTDPRAVLDSIGRQLLPEGDKYTVAIYKDLKDAMQPVARALRDAPTLIVVDNVETVLAPSTASDLRSSSAQDDNAPSPLRSSSPSLLTSSAPIFDLLHSLLPASPRTRLLFTSRERLPAPFDGAAQHIRLGGLTPREAVELVSRVMAAEGVEPPASDPGGTPAEVERLVETVGRHPRALVLLARETARRGVQATAENAAAIFAELERKHPGERENSLYASLELSLRRLTADERQQVRVLGAFHGGFTLGVLAIVMNGNQEIALAIAQALVEVGLAEVMEYNYLRLDPALPAYLWGKLDEAEQADARARWGQAMSALIGFLYQQRFQDAKLAQTLGLLELPNLIAALDWIEAAQTPERIVDLAGGVEELLAALDRPRALALAVAARERAAGKLGAWSHASFQAQDANFDRLLQAGNLQGALDTAQKLLARALAAGEMAYPGAAYHLAMANFNVGRVLQMGGAAGAALEPLAEAQRRFQALADARNADAARMVAAAIQEAGDCLQNIGQLDAAAANYEEVIERVSKIEDRRSVAVAKGNLGTVRMSQRRYGEALAAWEEARGIFEGLNESEGVATAWHQIGMVHRQAGNAEAAERAYRQSLALKVARGDKKGQASSLDELGLLDQLQNRLEEAVVFHQQAASLRFEIKDLAAEGRSRNNMAGA